MSRRVVTEDLCDRHLAARAEVPATRSVRVALDGKHRILDVCAECEPLVLGELRQLWGRIRPDDDAGDGRATRKHQDGARVCPVCAYPVGSLSTLSGHMRAAHDLSLSEHKAQQNGGGHPCPECGRTFERAQSLALHRTRSKDCTRG